MINGKRYIGQKKFSYGWENYLGSGLTLLKAIKKYGKESFKREIIAISFSKEESNKLEIMFIKTHDAVENLDYYNLAFGGEASPHSEESKNKNREAHKGKHLSEEHKAKIGKAGKGKHRSEETKQKISESHKGSKSYMYGKHPSEETRQKISKIQIKLTQEQVIEIREKYSTGNYSHRKLAKEYNISSCTIGSVINFRGVYK